MAIEFRGETYLNSLETAELTGYSKNSVYQYHKAWGWTPYKYGQSLMFKKSDIEKWIESRFAEGLTLSES